MKIQLSETFSSRRGQQATGHGIQQWILATTTAVAVRQEQQQEHMGSSFVRCSWGIVPRLTSVWIFFFLLLFILFLSWYFHAVAAFCMRRVPTAAAAVVAFLVAAVLHFVGCGTSGGSDKSQPSLCLYPNALILKAFKIFVRFRRHCSCLGRCPEHLFLYPTNNSAG